MKKIICFFGKVIFYIINSRQPIYRLMIIKTPKCVHFHIMHQRRYVTSQKQCEWCLHPAGTCWDVEHRRPNCRTERLAGCCYCWGGVGNTSMDWGPLLALLPPFFWVSPFQCALDTLLLFTLLTGKLYI